MQMGGSIFRKWVGQHFANGWVKPSANDHGLLSRHDSIENIAKHLLNNGAIQTEEGITFIGWSYTGLIAQALASLIEKNGIKSNLILLDSFYLNHFDISEKPKNSTEKVMFEFKAQPFDGQALLLKSCFFHQTTLQRWHKDSRNGWDERVMSQLQIQRLDDTHHYQFFEVGSIAQTANRIRNWVEEKNK
ncbi:MAG: hypothetical protein H6618_00230 [Deltaproteobacteria bacterium]|nr:hypothetical protein [Deltaproteobacteria bacterium]